MWEFQHLMGIGNASSVTSIVKCCNFRWHAQRHTVWVLGAAIAGSPNLGCSTECQRPRRRDVLGPADAR